MTQSEINTNQDFVPVRSPLEKSLDTGFRWMTLIFAISIALILISIALIVAQGGWPAMAKYHLTFFTNSNWNPVTSEYGVLAVIYGTLVSSFIALLIAIPLGLGAAVFLSEDFLPESVRTVLVF